MSNMLTWYKCFQKALGQHKKITSLKYITTLVKISFCTFTCIISNVEKAFGGDRKFQESLSGLPRVISLRKNSLMCAVFDSRSLGHAKTILRFAGTNAILCAWLLSLSEPVITQQQPQRFSLTP